MLTPLVPVLETDTILVLVAVVASVFGGMLALAGVVRLAHDLTERLLGALCEDPRAPAARG